MNENRNSNLLAGVVLGATIGAGLTFLFGTKKGKEIRKKVRNNYPELFDKLDNTVEDFKDVLEEKSDDLSATVKEIGKKLDKK